jgi:ABC-type transport system involved in multi-copper enzyme maturation permease subunit
MSTVTLVPPTVKNERATLPWKPMVRVTWLQHRYMVLSAAVLFAGLALYMLLTAPAIHSIYAQWVTYGCPTKSVNENMCMAAQERLLHSAINVTFINIALHVLPVVVGMFLGAPLIAREFESGTFQFTWTQGMPRARWFALKFTFLAVIVVVATSLLGILATSYSVPFNAVGLLARWQPGEFDVTGLTLAAWTLFALALGIFIGTLTKRVVSAMALTGVATGAVIVATFWKIHFLLIGIGTKVVKEALPSGTFGVLNEATGPGTSIAPRGSWLVNGWYTGPSGNVLSTHTERILISTRSYRKSWETHTSAQWLTTHHLSYWVSYQPSNRYWMFESIEAVTLVAVALVLAWGTSSLIRKRA